MPIAGPGRDDPGAVRAGDAWRVSAFTVAGSLLVLGLIMTLVGPTSLFPATGLGLWVGPALWGGAAAAMAALALPRRGAFLRALEAVAPRLFPLAPVGVSLAVYVTLMIGAVSVFHGFFDVFTGAHNGGQVQGLSDQDDLQFLLIGASVVVWILTVYVVVAFARVIRLGRYADRRRGITPYGSPPSSTNEEPPPLPNPRSPSPGPPRVARGVLLVTTVALAIVISAGIQLLEVNVGPAPAQLWLGAQFFAPVWALAVGAGISAADGAIRHLERWYVESLPTPPGAGPAPSPVVPRAPAAERSGFVQ